MKRIKNIVLAVLLAGGLHTALPQGHAAEPQPPLSRLSKQVLSRRVMKDIIGQEVISIDGKDAGVVFDLAVDSLDGRISYVVIDHRRNGRLHNVPLELFREEGGKLMVAVERDKLEPSRGYTKGDWPDMSDESWARKVHKLYGLTPYWELPSRRLADADPKSPKEKAGPKYNEKYNWINRASQMIGIPLKSDAGEDLGRVSDLVLDIRHGRGHLVYAVISGTPTLGDNISLVPFSAIQSKPKEKEFIVSATRDALRVGSLKESDWKTTADPSWNRRVHQAFKEEPYWSVFGVPEADDDAGVDAAWQPGGAYMRNFDTRKTRSFTGKVLSVGDFDLAKDIKGKQLVLLAEDDKQYTIHLGPASYFDKPQSRLKLKAGDQITVRAMRGVIDGKDVYLADQLAKVYDLRDSSGKGNWRSIDTDR
jgi:sporulation protein YlmC with PRC-barrel domain